MSGRGGNSNANSDSNSNSNSNSSSGVGRGRGRGRGRGGRGRGGRGRSTNGRGGRGRNSGDDGGPPPPPPPRQRRQAPKDPSQLKKNGEKGAEAHTVSEAERINFTKILMRFREGEESRMEFPHTLTNTERKFMHQLAGQLGLISKSTGKGETRRIAVTKRNEQTKQTTMGDDLGYPVLDIGKRGSDALQSHLSRHPPTHSEALESKETGASLVEAVTQSQGNDTNDGGDTAIAATLNQLGLGAEQQGVVRKIKPKYVNLDQRRARHAVYQQAKKKSSQFPRMQRQRQALPAYNRQEEIVETVRTSPVTIIQGETGCGKSTQCPQFLLDANPTANIVVTQPRRISAISIADRVAQEQCLTGDGKNGGVGSLVGYQVRLEAAATKDTQLIFVTPGILLRRLQSSPTLSEFTHIVIDEVHERDKYTEFLMITLRDLLPQRPDLRLVLMSATLQTELLINYFSDYDHPFYETHPPVVLEIEGRTFPVQEFFLESILQLTGYIDPAVAVAASESKKNSDGSDSNNDNNGVMSMADLDAELAKLIGGSAVATSTANEVKPANIQCVMCGERFVDHVTLGAHVAVCEGTKPSTNNATVLLTPDQLRQRTIDDDDAGDAILSPDADFEEYDEYDVNETVQVDGYDFQLAAAPTAGKPVVPEVDEAQKWDGTGQYLVQDETDVEITPEQDALLDHYQIMHDDEQVDTDLLLEVLQYIHKTSRGDGAILIFLPGWQEISEVNMLLDQSAPFHDRSRFLVLPLHSGIPSSDQRRVLQRPPAGIRKIILSTNIAETSLTIDDVAFVVDAGRAKEKDYDPHLKTSTLQANWISQASSKQRKGRAGRTKAGVCFHLFSSRRYQSMRAFVESELLRTPLEEMCLSTKKLGLAPGGPDDVDGVPAFLSKAISPPHEKSISNALELLVDLGAMLPETNDLTNLGQCLSILSVEPRVGKMVIWSYLLGCSRATAQMAVAMSYKSPFILPPQNLRREAEKAQVELGGGSESDQVTAFNAMLKHDQLKKKSEGAWRDFCRRNYVSAPTMQMVSELRRNITRELSSLDFPDPMKVSDAYHNRHHNKEALWQAALSAGLYPNVATRQKGDVNFSTMTNRKCKIHVSSVNAVKGQPLNGKCQIPKGEVEFVVYGEMVKGKNHFTISQTTHLVSPLPLLLLCGTSLTVHPDPSDEQYAILGLDDWVVFKCKAEVASGIVVLRKRLDGTFLHALSRPSSLSTQSMNPLERDAIEVLGQVLQSAQKSTNVR